MEEEKKPETTTDTKKDAVDNDKSYDEDGQVKGNRGPNMPGWKGGAYSSIWE